QRRIVGNIEGVVAAVALDQRGGRSAEHRERVVARTEVDVQRRDVEVVDAALASRELGRSGERRGVDGLDAGRASRALESDDKTVAVLGYRDIARMRLGR